MDEISDPIEDFDISHSDKYTEEPTPFAFVTPSLQTELPNSEYDYFNHFNGTYYNILHREREPKNMDSQSNSTDEKAQKKLKEIVLEHNGKRIVLEVEGDPFQTIHDAFNKTYNPEQLEDRTQQNSNSNAGTTTINSNYFEKKKIYHEQKKESLGLLYDYVESLDHQQQTVEPIETSRIEREHIEKLENELTTILPPNELDSTKETSSILSTDTPGSQTLQLYNKPLIGIPFVLSLFSIRF